MSIDDLSSRRITAKLRTRFMGRMIFYYPSLASTMDTAQDMARKRAPEGTAVIAGVQTAGRGRLERAWLSPQGGVALSVILRPALSYTPSLIMVASLAVVHTIKNVTGLESQIKWPNDVLIKGRKVCGILIENDIKGETVDHSVIGIGINVNVRMADFPGIQATAISLSDELGRSVSRLDIIRELLAELERLYLALQAGGPIFEEWRDNLLTLGKRVQVRMEENNYEGIAESVDRDGSLYLRKADGDRVKVVAGDVSHQFA